MANQKKIINMVLMLGASLFVWNLSPRAHEGHGWPCREDAEKFCKDVKPGGGRIIKCLKEHESELSEECKERGAAVKSKIKEKMGEMQEACKDDAAKFCKDVKPGEGGIVQCLKQHKDELSGSCKKFGGKMEGKREEWKEKRGRMHERMEEAQEACKEDFEKFCKDVKPGEGRIINCMKEHSSELSGGCKQAMHRKASSEHRKSDESDERKNSPKDEQKDSDEKGESEN